MSLQEACGCVCVCVPVPARGMRVCVVCNIYPRFQEARCPCKRCVGVGGVCVCVCRCPCKRHVGVCGYVTFIPGSKRPGGFRKSIGGLGVPARGMWVCAGCVWVCNVYPRFQEAWKLPGM